MPADFIKFNLLQEGIVNKLRQCPILDFNKRKTKNGNTVSEAWHKNMKFEIYEPSMVVEVSGSLHYLFNDGLSNWNDFTRLDLYDTIFTFCSTFGIEPQKTVLHGFEIAININVPFEPSYFIERILAYKTGTIERLTDKADEKNAIKIDFNQYRLKIYNKSNHQRNSILDSDINILRFEVKIKRMAKVSGIGGIKTLHDLSKIEVLQKLGRLLLDEFKELIISEPMNLDTMKTRERVEFNKMNCRNYWKSITLKSQRRDSKNKFRGLIKEYGNGLHDKTFNLASEKWFDLLQYDEDKIKFAPFNRGVVNVRNEEKFAPFDQLNIIGIGRACDNVLNSERIVINKSNEHFFKEKQKVRNEQRRCPNCKKSLNENQDEGMKYCNERCKEQKDKRNIRSNPRHSLITKINTSNEKYNLCLPLFENEEVLKLTLNQKELLGQRLGITALYVN